MNNLPHSDPRRAFRLSFFDLNRVSVHQPTSSNLPWFEDLPGMAKILDDLEEDWAAVAELGGHLPSGVPVSRPAIARELGLPDGTPKGSLRCAVLMARVVGSAIVLSAKGNLRALRASLR